MESSGFQSEELEKRFLNVMNTQLREFMTVMSSELQKIASEFHAATDVKFKSLNENISALETNVTASIEEVNEKITQLQTNQSENEERQKEVHERLSKLEDIERRNCNSTERLSLGKTRTDGELNRNGEVGSQLNISSTPEVAEDVLTRAIEDIGRNLLQGVTERLNDVLKSAEKTNFRADTSDPAGDDCDGKGSKPRKYSVKKQRDHRKKTKHKKGYESNYSSEDLRRGSISATSAYSSEVSSGSDSSTGKLKNGRTVKYLKSLKKSPSLLSPNQLLLRISPNASAFTAFTPIGTGNAGGAQVGTQVNLSPKPTSSDLCLDRVQLQELLVFQEGFLKLQQDHNAENLMITNHLSSRVISALTATVTSEREFKQYRRRLKEYGGIVVMGQQILTNDEVFEVLSYMARPRTRTEMDVYLGQSLWDPLTYQQFKDRSYIEKHMDEYVQEYFLYENRFTSLLSILKHEDTEEFFPSYLMKKGAMNGLVDYFLGGTPDVDFSYAVMRKYMDQESLLHLNSFSAFAKYYGSALRKLRDASRRMADTLSLFESEMKNVFSPPVGTMPLQGKLVTQGRERKILRRAANVENDVPQDDSWLATIRFSEDRPSVCFNFANSRHCSRLMSTGKCQFSHHPEDIRMWEEAKAMGPEAFKAVLESRPRGASASGGYRQTRGRAVELRDQRG